MAAESGLDRSIQPEGDVRSWEGRGPHRRQTSCSTLVGERRVVVAVGEHDVAGRKRRRDDLGDELAAGSHEQVHLGFGVYLEALVEEDVANLLAELLLRMWMGRPRLSAWRRLSGRRR